MWSYIFSIWVLLSLFFPYDYWLFLQLWHYNHLSFDYLCQNLFLSALLESIGQYVLMSVLYFFDFYCFSLIFTFPFVSQDCFGNTRSFEIIYMILGTSPTTKKYSYNSSFASNCIGIRGPLGEHRYLNNTVFSNILT